MSIGKLKSEESTPETEPAKLLHLEKDHWGIQEESLREVGLGRNQVVLRHSHSKHSTPAGQNHTGRRSKIR